jgi:tetratricopeptide (TPR) repeat protein
MKQKIEVRVLSHIYWIMGLIVLTAAASLSIDTYSDWIVGLLILAITFILVGRLEKVSFDGKDIVRSGLLAFLESVISGKKTSLALDQIEMVATEAIRSRRGLRHIKYLYKIAISGKNIQLILMVNSNQANDKRHALVKELFNLLPESKIDPRSSELKQHLNNPDKVIAEINNQEPTFQATPTNLLRKAANSLKLEGKMQEALKCFSLAYKKDPRNPQLLYEMARFFRSLSMIDSPQLVSRSRACLRLAAFLAKNEPHLLERIGETYFERLEYKLAARCFSRALAVEPMLYRSNIGLAEIALRDGKLAHVAHFYMAAASVSNDKAQKELATREANYYERLCSDEDYFEAEINRINKLKNFQWARDWASLLLITFWLLALLSGQFSADIGTFAWSIVFSSSFVWFASVLFSFHYSQRHP